MSAKKLINFKKLNKSTVIHPFLFAILPIILLFSNNVNTANPYDLILPLILSIFAALIIWIPLSVILKSKIKSGLITSLSLILFFSYGHIYVFFDDLQNDVNLSHFFLLIPTFILLGLGSYYFIKTKKPLNNATIILNIISISLIIVSFASIVEYVFTESYSLNNSNEILDESTIKSVHAGDFPDIYYILLDGYAGSESLHYFLNYDNNEFINFLTEKEFYVASESFSNYQRTSFSIPSTFNMKYLNYLAEEKGLDSQDENQLIKLARENLVVQKLKSKGYTFVAIESGSSHTKNMKDVDLRKCQKNNYATSEFNMVLLRTTILNPLHVQMFSGDHREKILCGFSELTQISHENEKPKFVLAHLMIPHAPYIFGPNGEAVIPKSLSLNVLKEWDGELYLGNLQFANKKTQEVVSELIQRDPPPIIIIQSDHGMRGSQADERNTEYERWLKPFNNFKAYYFPEKGRNLEFETSTPVNSFRVLFNLYFDEQNELLEDKLYYTPEDNPYQFVDVTDSLIKKLN